MLVSCTGVCYPCWCCVQVSGTGSCFLPVTNSSSVLCVSSLAVGITSASYNITLTVSLSGYTSHSTSQMVSQRDIYSQSAHNQDRERIKAGQRKDKHRLQNKARSYTEREKHLGDRYILMYSERKTPTTHHVLSGIVWSLCIYHELRTHCFKCCPLCVCLCVCLFVCDTFIRCRI